MRRPPSPTPDPRSLRPCPCRRERGAEGRKGNAPSCSLCLFWAWPLTQEALSLGPQAGLGRADQIREFGRFVPAGLWERGKERDWGRPRPIKEEAACRAHDEDTHSFAAGALGLGAGSTAAPQVRPRPQHPVPRPTVPRPRPQTPSSGRRCLRSNLGLPWRGKLTGK